MASAELKTTVFDLPTELLADILIEVVWDSGSWMESLRDISLVCKVWRDLAAETPAFYTRIDMNYKRPAVKYFLNASRGSPLTITCTNAFYTSQTDSFAELLTPHVSRVQSFEYNGTLTKFLEPLITHARDVNIHYTGYSNNQTDMLSLTGTEPLRTFSNQAVWMDYNSPRLIRLRSLSLNDIRFRSPTMLQILSILDASPCLEVLRLVDIGTNLEDPFREDAPELRNPPTLPKLHLPFLNTLEMKRIPHHTLIQISSDVFATAHCVTETENLSAVNLIGFLSKVALPAAKQHDFTIHFRRVWEGRQRRMGFERMEDGGVSFDVCPGERELFLTSLATAISRLPTARPARLNLTTDPGPKRRLGLHLSNQVLNSLATVETISLGHRIDAGTLLCRLAKPMDDGEWLCPNLKKVYVEDVEDDFLDRFTSLGWEDTVARSGMWVDCSARVERIDATRDAVADVESTRLEFELDGLDGLFAGSDW